MRDFKSVLTANLTEIKLDDATETLQKFMQALSKERCFRGCKFGEEDRFIDRDRKLSVVWMFFENELLARGKIGYQDVGVNSYLMKFSVESANITNNKVRGFSWQFHCASSESMERAVKIAKANLRAYTDDEIIKRYGERGVSAFVSARNDAENTEYSKGDVLKDQILYKKIMYQEFKNLLGTSYTFVNKKAELAVNEFVTACDEGEAIREKSMKFRCALVYPDRVVVREYQKPIQGKDIGSGTVDKMFRHPAESVCYTEHTLPQELKETISALSLVDVGEYVAGLGTKVSDNIFYLVQPLWEDQL